MLTLTKDFLSDTPRNFVPVISVEDIEGVNIGDHLFGNGIPDDTIILGLPTSKEIIVSRFPAVDLKAGTQLFIVNKESHSDYDEVTEEEWTAYERACREPWPDDPEDVTLSFLIKQLDTQEMMGVR